MKTITLHKKLNKFLFLVLFLTGFTQVGLGQVSENFDGLTKASYGNYDYNGFHIQNGLCNSENSRTGNAVRTRNTSGTYLRYVGSDGNGKDGGVGTISFWYRSWDNSPAAVLDVKIKIGAGSWTIIGSQINTTSETYSQWSYDLNDTNDDIQVSIDYVSGERLHIDDFSIADYAASGPEINLTGNGNDISDESTSPSATNDTDFGSVLTSSGTNVNVFTIQNTGSSNLTLDGTSPYVVISGSGASNFSVTGTTATTPIAASGNTTFEITFDPSTDGQKDATLTIANSDGDEDPYNFDITGFGSNGATITVTEEHPDEADETNGPQVVASTTPTSFNFNNVYTGAFQSPPRIYQVAGTGLSADIVITVPTGYEVSTSCSSGYGTSVTLTQSSGTVSSTTVYVIFNPTSYGTHSGNITHVSTGATTLNISVDETNSATNLSGTYYNTATGTGATLKTNLKNIIDGHTARTYTNLWTDFQTTDKKANGKVYDMYSDNGACTLAPYEHIYTTSQCGNQSGEGYCYNREHSFPASWFDDASPTYTDLFHLVPTDGKVNSIRSNYVFGEVTSASQTTDNGSKLGTNTYSGAPSNTCFEPIDEYKGDFARNYFYIATRYEDVIDAWEAIDIGSDGDDTNDRQEDILDGTEYPCFDSWFINMLLAWHAADPVDQKEKNRNDAIFGIQGNRNPFIDNPTYATDIWAAGPVITTSISSLTGFTYLDTDLGPSAEQSFTVEGSSLTADITITAPTNYEISETSGSAYTSPITLTQTGGTVSSTTIYVRLKASLSAGDYNSENIAHSSTGATTKNVVCDGTVTTSGGGGGCATDLFISEYCEGSSNNKYIEVYNGTGATVDFGSVTYALNKSGNGGGWGTAYTLTGTLADGDMFILANSSANATITAAADDTESTVTGFNGNDAIGLFKSGTLIDVIGNPNSGSTFAENTTLIRNSSVTVGVTTYASGEWTSNVVDYFDDIGSHTIVCGPTITISPTSLAFGDQCINTTSSNSTYTVSGSDLTADISITAPTAYEISTSSGSGFGSSLTLTKSGSSVAETTIYVRFTPTAASAYNANITHTSTDADQKDLALTGTGVNSPPSIDTPTSANVDANSADLGGNITDLGCADVTERGIYYSTTDGFTDGLGTKVSVTPGPYTIGAFTINVTSLTAGTVYYYKAFALSSIETAYTTQGTFTTLTDQTSEAYEPGTKITGASIVSNSTAYTDAFKIIIKDNGAGTGDGLDTKVTKIRVIPNAATNTADWTNTIQAVKLNDGNDIALGTVTINDSYIDIEISSGNLEANNDGTEKVVTLSFQINNTNLVDNSVVSFLVDADTHGFTTDATGSGFISTFASGTDFYSNDYTITVDATKIVFAANEPPSSALINENISVTINAVDDNGNVDTNKSNSVTLSKATGSGTMAGGEAQNLSSGTYTWSNVNFNASDIYRITATTTGLASNTVSSGDINITNVFKFQGWDKDESSGGKDNWNYNTESYTDQLSNTHAADGGSLHTGNYTAYHDKVITPTNENGISNIKQPTPAPNCWKMVNGNNLVMENVDISAYSDVKLQFTFAANDADNNSELKLKVSYDATSVSPAVSNWVTIKPITNEDYIAVGASWTNADAEWNFGETQAVDGNTSTADYPENPFILEIDDTKKNFACEFITGENWYIENVQLTGTYMPLTVTTLNFMGVTETTAIVNAELEYLGGKTITERGIAWGTATAPTTKISVAGTGLGYYTANLSGLSAGNTYFVRAYVITDEPATYYGNELEFTTCDGVGECKNNTGLLISEYIESSCDGSGGHSATNNAIEIFNGTGSTVNMKHYRLQHDASNDIYNSVYNFYDIDVPNNQTFIISNAGSNAIELKLKANGGQADAQDGVASISGDEQFQLLKTIDNYQTYAVIDHIGYDGANWGEEKTFARNPDILSPKIQAGDGSATDLSCDPNTNGEWILYPDCYYDDLGSHRVDFDWQGDVDSDWFKTENWNLDRIPTRSSTSTISDVHTASTGVFPIITDNATDRIAGCYNLVIETNSNITIGTDGLMSVTGSISNSSGAAGVIIKSGNTSTGSLILAGGTTAATVERYIVSDAWHAVSPTTGTVPSTDYELAGTDYLYSYAETADDFWNTTTNFDFNGIIDAINYNETVVAQGWLAQSGNAIPGYGYFYKTETSQALTLDGGNLFVGDIDISTTYSDHSGLDYGGGVGVLPTTGEFAGCADNWPEYDGWVLVGNPYASAIDWELINDDDDIENTAYMWDGANSNYKYFLNSGTAHVTIGNSSDGSTDDAQYIPAGQGFFVKAINGGTDNKFTIPASARVHTSHGFWKKGVAKEEISDMIKMRIAKNDFYDETVIWNIEGSTEGQDGNFDIRKRFSLNNLVPQLYTANVSGSKFALNSFPHITETKVIPMGLYIGENGDYSINMTENNFEEMHVWLEDVEIGGDYTNMNTKPVYNFTANTETDVNRFILHLTKNTNPVVVNAISAVSANEDELFNYDLQNVFTDADMGDVLTYSITLSDGSPIPAWLTYNAEEITGTPENSDVGIINLNYIATDIFGAVTSTPFTLTVNNVNDAPFVVNQVISQTATEDIPFNLSLTDVFDDIDVDDVLSYSITLFDGNPIPTWLIYNAEGISGTPENGDVGIITLKYAATDILGETASSEFTLTVNNVNDAPVLNTPIEDVSIYVNEYWSSVFANNMFTDIDLNDELTYSAKLSDGNNLPNWITFDNINRSFTGTPDAIQIIDIQLTATDIFGANVSDEFNLEVKSIVSVSELNKYSVFVYPNPTNGIFTIQINNSDKTALVSISNITGQVLKQLSINNKQASIDLSNFAKGIYFIDIEIDNQIVRKKIVLK